MSSQEKEHSGKTRDYGFTRKELLMLIPASLALVGVEVWLNRSGLLKRFISNFMNNRSSEVRVNIDKQDLVFSHSNPVINKDETNERDTIRNFLEDSASFVVDSIKAEQDYGLEIPGGNVFSDEFLDQFAKVDNRLALRRVETGKSHLGSGVISNLYYDLVAISHDGISDGSFFAVGNKLPNGPYIPVKPAFSYRVTLTTKNEQLRKSGWLDGVYTLLGVETYVIPMDPFDDLQSRLIVPSPFNTPLRIVALDPKRRSLTQNNVELKTLEISRKS